MNKSKQRRRPSPQNECDRMTTLDLVVEFLQSIGLPCEYEDNADGFLKGIRIEGGQLFVSPTAKPGDLLHEAGHLCTLPGRFRPLAENNLAKVMKFMLETVDFTDPDKGEARAAIQCCDTEATAWGWAAGVHLGIAHDVIIESSSYEGTGATVRFQLASNQYLGINGLAAAKFCVVRPGALEAHHGLPAFPKLGKWLQEDFGLEAIAMPKRSVARP